MGQSRGEYFGRCNEMDGMVQLNNNEFEYREGDQEVREGEFWFNIYPDARESIKLSDMLVWLSKFVGDKNVTVLCNICRPIDYTEMKREMKKCLTYDSQIFEGTFLEGFQNKDVIELTRESSFSSLDITKQAILSELERYKTLNMALPNIHDYDIKELITLTDKYKYISFLHYLINGVWVYEGDPEQLKNLLHITGTKGQYILNNLPEEHEINRLINQNNKNNFGRLLSDEVMGTRVEKIKNYYIQEFASLPGCDINKLNLYVAHDHILKSQILEELKSFDYSTLCQILLFMKLMRENLDVRSVS